MYYFRILFRVLFIILKSLLLNKYSYEDIELINKYYVCNLSILNSIK